MQIRGLHLSSRCYVILIITFIRFHDVLAGDCGGVLTDQAGNILTPNYPNNYPNNVDCHWTIVVATGQVISLKLTTFNVGFSDRVSVYDGDSTQSSLLGTYWGFWDEEQTEQFLLRSRGPSLHVYFRSGSGVTGTGFAASYWAHECRPFTYGRSGCTQPCQCVQNNTDFCRSLTGECVCKAGWEQSTCSTQHVYYQPADVDECRDPNICPGPYSTCINKPGSYECACKPGLNKIGQMCYDTCTRKEKHCSGICGVTSLSPYTEQCYCPKGKYLNYTDGQTCIECSDWMYGEDCKYTSSCNRLNTKSLNKTNGYCTCDIHWESTNCDVDFNGAHPCNQTSSFCRNTPGAFECACLPGFYTFNSTICQACDNIIKNASGSIVSYFYRGSAYSQLCAWTIVVPEGLVVDLKFQHFSMGGSAHLDIYDGGNTSATLIGRYYYQPSVVRTTGNTMHIVRLETSPFYLGYGFTASFTSFECPPFTYGERCQTSCDCVQNHTSYCNNMNGQCVCKPQWTSLDCSLYKNECDDNPLACPDYSDCIYNGNGTFYCQCFDGLVLAAGGTCVIKNSENACTNRNCSHMCVLLQQLDKTNKVTCYCPIGMFLQGNNCQPCVNLTYANHCSRHCQCDADHTASCDTRVGWCSCKQGWTSRDCSQDINECYTGQNICHPYAVCVNTPGDYTCTCPHENGLMSVGEKLCEDIKCSYTFSNTTGVIQSPDYPQYYYNRAHCTWDITAEINHIISVNFSEFSIQNHYSCAYDAVSFYDGNSTSRKLIGTYCGHSIPKIVRSTGNNMHIVFTSDTSDTGRFYGTYVSHSCEHFKFGPTCAEYCHCAEANTLYCDNILGKCICGRGWMGDTCHDDVNECLGTNNKLCPDNSVCKNTRGSYSCQCNLGYFLNTSTGQCDEFKGCFLKQCSHGCYKKNILEEFCTCPEDMQLGPDGLTCVVPFYPYGAEAGDQLLDHSHYNRSLYSNGVLVSQPVQFSSAVPFGDAQFTTAYVLSSGAISFCEDSILGAPDLQYANSNNHTIIAPYWANIDTSQGQVNYHLYEKCGRHVFDGTEDHSPHHHNITQRVEKDIAKFHNLDGFFASSVLVVTWVSVKPLTATHFTTNQEENTFQAIFVTGWESRPKLGHVYMAENISSYVIYIYQQGKMNWNFIEGREIQIGFTAITRSHFMTFTETITVLAVAALKWNTDYEGVMSYHTGSVKSHAQTCQRYLCRQLSLLNNPVYEREKQNLYKCPCTLERLGHQWQLYERRGPDLNIECYAISLPSKTLLLADNTRNKLCCYNRLHSTSTSWEEEEQCRRSSSYIPASRYSGHVLINDPWSWAFFSNKEALENMRAHGYCCSGASPQLCDRFHKIFPDMGCSNFVTFVPASAFGDPHITTLDGVEYTMNGWGEYVMMDVPASKFMFQVRTSRSMSSDGKATNATVFTKLAAKEWENSSLEVELAPNNTSMIIYINGVDYTNEFYSSPDFATELRTIQVVRQNSLNNSLLVGSFPCGVSIKVSVAVKCLKIDVDVEKQLKNKTRGLLGNFNENIADEFTLQNGTVLASNMTERDILYKFAKNWEVTAETSIFTYGRHESFSDYQHPEFVPLFQDQTDPVLRSAGANLCGEGNTACVYDFVATRDAAFANMTKVSKETLGQQKNVLANTPPTLSINISNLTARGQLLLTQGRESSLDLNVADDDGDMMSVETVGDVPGVHIDHVTKRLLVTPSPGLPISFGLRAKDKRDAYSPIVYISPVLCTGCSGHGQCDPTATRGDLGSNIQKLRCVCGPAYTGADCESEVDACATRPCSLGQTCTDLTAAQQGSNTTGYICGPCPVGYTDQAGRCVDEDECASDPNICDQQCTNTEGSYYCSCNTGYRLDQIQKRSCSDINECDEKMSGCQQLCVNTEGSYNCSCYEGYQLDDDGFTCHMDTILLDNCAHCQHTCILNTQYANYSCQCNKGYVTNPNNTAECLDVDECSLENMPCSQTCVNTKGSFHCSCYRGFKLQTDGISCQKCELPNYGDNCKSKCDCKGRGSCDTVKGCMCDDGWTGVSCDVDVDECADHTTCPEGFICENTMGSFLCKCPDGYEQQSEGCNDINECVDISVNVTCDLRVEICVNTPGSYRCECKPGYARNDKSVCQDIDECELQIDGCQHICHNVDGKYNCQCEPGYILRENRRDCISVKDLCAGANLNCTQGCSLDKNNQPTCICLRGYNKTIENGRQICNDIDECASNETNKCAYKDKCTNTEGGYTCSCPAGFCLDNNGWNCLACTGDTWGINCQHSCSCGLGTESCSPVSGCVCKHGFTGAHCETDIDECIEGSVICKSNEVCVNIPGNASCVCQSGFKISDNNSCSDIDECAEPTLNNCTQVCNNTEGSYTCSCHDGYIFNIDANSCEDLNECQGTLNKCQGQCENTEGSYRCSCNKGLYLDLDGVSCVVDKPCRNQSMSCSYKCANIDDKDTCLCPKGQNVSSDLSTCIDCLDGYYGDNCKEICTCNKNNTKHCEKINGVCECLQGWKGSNCEIDVDECLENASLCLTKPRSHCVNIGGTYKCDCDTGYIQTTSSNREQCTECDAGLYGEGCTKPCQCVSENTEHCSNIDGACTCKQGWRGDHCEIDIDECVLTPNLCEMTPHTHCVNTDGSHQCVCNTGYTTNSQVCQECAAGWYGEQCSKTCDCVHDNTEQCNNVDGSCKCKQGWRGDHCQILIDVCKDNPNQCSEVPNSHCENSDATYTCVCDEGYIQMDGTLCKGC